MFLFLEGSVMERDKGGVLYERHTVSILTCMLCYTLAAQVATQIASSPSFPDPDGLPL